MASSDAFFAGGGGKNQVESVRISRGEETFEFAEL